MAARIGAALVMGLAAAGGIGGCCAPQASPEPASQPALKPSSVESSAAAASSAARPAAEQPSGPSAAPAIQATFVPEMEPFGEQYSTLARVSGKEFAAFGDAWRRARPQVEAMITPERLVSISRWAAAETKTVKLEPGWLERLPVELRGASADGARLLFSQRPEQSSAELPTHRANVHRRILVAPVYDRDSRAISAVYVSIGGWAEE